MTDSCQRAAGVSAIAFLSDPEGAQWNDFRAHAAECPVCREEIEGWRGLEGVFVALSEVEEGVHPSAKEFVAYRRHRESLSEDQRARIAGHLAQCADCREENAFVDSFDVSRLDALRFKQGVKEQVIASRPLLPLAALWRDVTAGAKELTCRLVIELRDVAAVFVEPPAGLVPVPYVAYTPTRRASSKDTPPVSVASGESISIPLADPGLSVRVVAERQDAGHVRLGVTPQGEFNGPVAMSLREKIGDKWRLISAQSTDGGDALIVEDLVPGEYSLEVREIESKRSFQVPLPVIPGARQ